MHKLLSSKSKDLDDKKITKIKSKNIAFVDNSLNALVNFRGEVIKELISEGHSITLLAPNDYNKTIDMNVCYIDLKFDRGSLNPFSNFKLFLKFLSIYRKLKFDIIFHYTIKPNIFGSLAARLARIKSVSVIPGVRYLFISGSSKLRSIVGVAYKIALKSVAEVWFLNEDDKKLFIKSGFIDKNKMTIILPSEGINTAKFIPQPFERNLDDKKVRFLMIARILWDKGFKEYVTAAGLIKKKYENVEFSLLGGLDIENPMGVSEEELLKYCADNTVKYLGYSSNVMEIIKDNECIVLPSYGEGKPMVLLEAMACSRPIIATNVVGSKDVVIDGYNGFLCEAKSPELLAQQIEKFINLSHYEREVLGSNGRKFVCDNFDISFVIEEYKKFVNERGGGAILIRNYRVSEIYAWYLVIFCYLHIKKMISEAFFIRASSLLDIDTKVSNDLRLIIVSTSVTLFIN